MSILLYRKQKGIVDRKGLCLASVNLDCKLLKEQNMLRLTVN